MPDVTKNDIYLPIRCSRCNGELIIIPAHGLFVQHEDADLEADHRPTSLSGPTTERTEAWPADNPDSVKSTENAQPATYGTGTGWFYRELAQTLRQRASDILNASDYMIEVQDWFDYELDPFIRKHLPDENTRPEGRMEQLRQIVGDESEEAE